MASSVPTTAELDDFRRELRSYREQLSTLSADDAFDWQALTHAIDALSEQLGIADEELRVQNEQLRQSSRRLDLLVAEHEELFANAPIAYVETDADGVILRYNRAAHRLLGLASAPRARRTLTGQLSLDQRPALRTLISRLHARRTATPVGGHPEPIQVQISRPDGRTVPVVIAGRVSRNGLGGRPTLHFELRERISPVAATPLISAGPGVAAHPECAATIAAAAAEFALQESPAATLDHIARHALAAVPAAADVGIVMLGAGRHGEAPVHLGELAAGCDRLQCELGEGPSLGAMEVAGVIRVRDLADDRRWPRFAGPASRLGARSVLALPLATSRGMQGALNLYSTVEDAFSEDDEILGAAYATHAGIALAHAELEASLRTGLATREEIGRAVGILMERHKVLAAQAFDMLVYASQHSHRKLRDIAAWMTETGEDPSSLFAG